jgi:DNA polymerase III delta subunit
MHALFDQTLKTDAAELVFYLLAKRLNQLFIAKSGDMEQLKKELRQDWQIRNIQHQASAWTDDQLAAANKRLLEIDESIKTGASPIDLALQLDILLLTL